MRTTYEIALDLAAAAAVYRNAVLEAAIQLIERETNPEPQDEMDGAYNGGLCDAIAALRLLQTR